MHREPHDTIHGVARVDHAAHVGVARARRLARLQQTLHRRDQLLVVPRLTEVIGGAFLHELHSRLERCPGGDEENRQIGIDRSQPAKKFDAFLPARIAGSEVHVLQHDAHFAAFDHRDRTLRARCALALDRVQIEKNGQRFRDRGLILDDEHFHRSEGLGHRDASDQTLLVATAGETLAPRIAGGMVAMSPLTHSSTMPTAT